MSTANTRASGWHERHPDRWANELRALDATGWRYRARDENGNVWVELAYPLPARECEEGGTGGAEETPSFASLTVRFPQTYPHFPAEVFDTDNSIGATRHREPLTGMLCLAHPEHHHPSELLADVLTRQLPKFLTVEKSPALPAGLEDPVVGYTPDTERQAATLVVPDTPVPAHLDSGALEVRYPLSLLRGERFSTGLVTTIFGEGFKASLLPAGTGTHFPVTAYGRWLRDPDFRLGQPAEEVWDRIKDRLPALEVPGSRWNHDDGAAAATIGLLVPDTETAYRVHGDSWVFLQRMRLRQPGHTDSVEARWLADAAYINSSTQRHRTPLASALTTTRVVLVGCGAIGHHIALDLGRTGVGRLHLIDGDVIDPATASRQYAPTYGAGHSKVCELALAINANNPSCDVHVWQRRVHTLWESQDEHAGAARSARDAIATADLVIDATADPNVTSFLGAIRHARGLPFLAVAGTAGIWGGWVAAFDPRRGTGCVECLTHHRADPASPIPVPPADPSGWANPPRCSQPTFTGTNADVATIAHHASRIATHRLADKGAFEGDYHVAALRDPHGVPQPAAWTTCTLPPHPRCRCHTTAPLDQPQPSLPLQW